MLLTLTKLDPTALSHLKQLMQRCKQQDGNVIAYYPNLLAHTRPTPATLMYYNDHQQLISFAAVFFFEENIGEISLATDPRYRDQGLARQLLRTLLENLHQEQIVEIIRFSFPVNHYDSPLIKRNFYYHHSEYDMEHTLLYPISLELNDVEFIEASPEHIPVMQELDSQCFPKSPGFSRARFIELLADPNYCIFLAIHQGQIIGKSHLACYPQSTRLSDIAIAPAFQSRGFGRQLIIHSMNHAWLKHSPHLTLSVETNNRKALTLYKHLGFTISNAIDFWQKPLLDLKNGCQ